MTLYPMIFSIMRYFSVRLGSVIDRASISNLSTKFMQSSLKSRRDHSRFVCCGDAASGKIHLRDPLNLKVTHTLDTNTGVLSDFDVHGHHLVTCGQSMRHGGVPQPDRFLMVYDLRVRLKGNI